MMAFEKIDNLRPLIPSTRIIIYSARKQAYQQFVEALKKFPETNISPPVLHFLKFESHLLPFGGRCDRSLEGMYVSI